MRAPRIVAFALGSLVAGCGGGSDSPTAATPTPAAAGGMTLMAHLDTATLTSKVLDAHGHVHAARPGAQLSHDEEIVLPDGAASGSGNWGYTTPDGRRRFALTGTSVGLSIVEVTDPARPVNIGLVPGPQSTWREVKTYGTYAYISTEAKHGLSIVDLSNPDQPRLVQTWDKSFKSAHTLWVDHERGLLFANGAGTDEGRTGTHIVSLANPEEPEELGRFGDYYIHDSFTRGDVLFASAIFDGWQALIDTRDPRRPREITRFFTGRRFTHSAALTPDGRYLFTTDERLDAPVEGWDISDPLRPVKVSEFLARAGSIPHNVQIDGMRLLVAHYTEGVVLLSIQNPAQPRVIGSYDTYDGTLSGFHGVWGAYIFPGTNLIVASDIEGGLFVLRQN